jgi:serine/threonine-protein kinase
MPDKRKVLALLEEMLDSGRSAEEVCRDCPDKRKVLALLEEMLDSGRSAEEVCRDCPELLPEIQRRWKKFRLVDEALQALLPGPNTPRSDDPTQVRSPDLPVIPGYRVEGLLGHGGMGIVYRAWHLRLNRPVALKMLLAGPSARPQELQRFLREAQAVAGLHHANIVQVYDVGEVDGRPYFTMELVEGGNLANQIKGVPQPARQAATLVATLAEAVHTAHQSGIVHRDLKPSNILLALSDPSHGVALGSSPDKSGHYQTKVSDFGLARQLEGDAGVTLSGAPLGTPSYMAPEQARGRRSAIGPATDVYALGAILYEMLTGRPPFAGESSTDTLQQVVTEDPVPPRQLNPRLPRDLETICLKCLQKEPGSRYASARELADDLQRFLNDEPIRARPPGGWERSRRWLRRRPAVAVGVMAAALLMIGLASGGLWLNRQHAAQARGVDEDLREARLQEEKFAWAEAAAAIERAKGRLGAGGPAELHRRVEQASIRLDEARRDVSLAARLDVVRLKRATHVEGYFNSASERRFTNSRADQDYEQTFREGGFEEVSSDQATAAAHVRESVVAEALLTGLTDWAVCAVAPDRQDWLLAVAREANPNAWSNRVLDPAAWGHGATLAKLAQVAPETEQPTPLLLALAERLQATSGDAVGLVRRLFDERPDDFWVNFAAGKVLREEGQPEEAVKCYHKALQIRPEAAVSNNLGLAMYDAHARRGDGNWSDPIKCYQKLLDHDRQSAPAHNNFGVVMKIKGDWEKAEQNFRLALQLDPGLAPAHCNLGVIKAYGGDLAEATKHFREGLRLDPQCAVAHYHLGVVLLGQDRIDATHDTYQRALHDDARNRGIYDKIFRMAHTYALEHYQWAVQFDPRWALTPSALGLTPQARSRLAEALDRYDKALAIDPRFAVAEGARGQALMAEGRFREAVATTRRCLELLAQKSYRLELSSVGNAVRQNLPAQLRHCEHLLELESRLPAVLRREENLSADERLEFAELCAMKGRYATAAGLYVNAFEGALELAEDLGAGHRHKAACAAALAGFGSDADMAGLSEEERARWRRQARTWLRADVVAWTQKLDTGIKTDRELVQKVSARWWADPGLAWLHEASAVEALPPAERQECLALWQDAGAVIKRGQTTK